MLIFPHLLLTGTKMFGKVAVVTGSTGGIGLGIAEALAGKGCNLVITGIADEQTIDTITTKLKTYESSL